MLHLKNLSFIFFSFSFFPYRSDNEPKVNAPTSPAAMYEPWMVAAFQRFSQTRSNYFLKIKYRHIIIIIIVIITSNKKKYIMMMMRVYLPHRNLMKVKVYRIFFIHPWPPSIGKWIDHSPISRTYGLSHSQSQLLTKPLQTMSSTPANSRSSDGNTHSSGITTAPHFLDLWNQKYTHVTFFPFMHTKMEQKKILYLKWTFLFFVPRAWNGNLFNFVHRPVGMLQVWNATPVLGDTAQEGVS